MNTNRKGIPKRKLKCNGQRQWPNGIRNAMAMAKRMERERQWQNGIRNAHMKDHHNLAKGKRIDKGN